MYQVYFESIKKWSNEVYFKPAFEMQLYFFSELEVLSNSNVYLK